MFFCGKGFWKLFGCGFVIGVEVFDRDFVLFINCFEFFWVNFCFICKIISIGGEGEVRGF